MEETIVSSDEVVEPVEVEATPVEEEITPEAEAEADAEVVEPIVE